MQIDALGECARTFHLEIFGTQRTGAFDITDNFSMFRRMLWEFTESIRTGQPAIPPERTLEIMRVLIAGRMPAKKTGKSSSMKSHYKSLFELTGKTAIVTGAVGILGQRFCRGLAEFGAQVAVVDLDPDRCTAFAGELERDYGTPALGVACDVADPASVANMVDQVVKRFGAIHVLHNNAASKSADLDAFFASTEKYSLPEWRKNHVGQCRRHVPRRPGSGRPDAKAGNGRQHHPDGFHLRHRVVGQADLRGVVLSRPPDQQPGGVFNIQGRGRRVDALPCGELGLMRGFA